MTAILLALLAVAVFVSTALTNILAGLVSMVAIIRWASDRPWHLLRQPLSVACLAFLGWSLLRELAAGASPQEMLATLDHLRVLLFIPLWAPLFVSQRNRDLVVQAGMGLLAAYAALALGLLAFTGRIPYSSIHPSLHHELGGPVAWQLVVATLVRRAAEIAGPVYIAAIFGALQVALDRPRWRRWLLAFACLLTAALLIATVRRQTQLGFFLCLFVFAWVNRRQIPWRAVAAGAVGLALATPLLLMTPAASGLQRVADAAAKWVTGTASQRTEAVEVTTSEGQRLRLWDNALPAIRQHPWAGTAVSHYDEHYLATVPARLHSITRTANPHNEYLYIWGSLGAIGLLLYLAVPAAAWNTLRHDALRRRILLYYLVAMFNAMAVNSLVIDMVAAHAHALVLLVLVMPAAAARMEHRA